VESCKTRWHESGRKPLENLKYMNGTIGKGNERGYEPNVCTYKNITMKLIILY
jgi:hypothetical protein